MLIKSINRDYQDNERLAEEVNLVGVTWAVMPEIRTGLSEEYVFDVGRDSGAEDRIQLLAQAARRQWPSVENCRTGLILGVRHDRRD